MSTEGPHSNSMRNVRVCVYFQGGDRRRASQGLEMVPAMEGLQGQQCSF